MIERPPDTRGDLLWDAVDELRCAVVSPGSSEAQVCLAQAHAARAHGLALVDLGISLRRIANAIDGQAGTTWMPGRTGEITGDGTGEALPLVTRADVAGMLREAGASISGESDRLGVVGDVYIDGERVRGARLALAPDGAEAMYAPDPAGAWILAPAPAAGELPRAALASPGVRTLRYRRA